MKQEINEKQQAAIRHKDGAALVLAGPGAGKTFVLVRRTMYLVSECGIPDEQILVITFTRAAAEEMRARYRDEMMCSDGVVFGTFHSIFLSILKEEYGLKNEQILDAKTKQYLLSLVASEMGIDTKGTDDFFLQIEKEMGYVKNAGIDPEEAESKILSAKKFKRFFKAYEKAKQDHGKIDFDDMLTMTHKLLTDKPAVLEKWRKRFRYFLVDEAQDMNTIQYEIIRLIAAPDNNLFFVGDDDQSIYGFRAANPGWMLTFGKDFPDGKQIILDTNYRSAKAIVSASKQLIRSNEERIDKDYTAFSKSAGKISYHPFSTQKEEAKQLARMIYEEKKLAPQKTIAVLFRNHSLSKYVIGEFKRCALAFSYDRKKGNPYEHFIYKDVESYFRIATGKRSRGDYLRILNRPERMLPRKGLEREEIRFEEWRGYHSDSPMTLQRIREFEQGLRRMEMLPSFGALAFLFRGMGYETFAFSQMKKEGESEEKYEKIFHELTDLSRRYPDKRRFLDELKALREEDKKQSDEERKKKDSPDIMLLSFHGSKGLEFDHVYIIDACDGITPSKKAKKGAAFEEERRMFYVAVTRAKEELTIFTVARRGNEVLYPSRFIKEMVDNKGSI